MLKVIRLMDDLPAPGEVVVYLAGPMPRDPAERSWHDDAIRELLAAGFAGTAIDPTPRGKWPADPDEQIEWEFAAMNRADALMFWIPRSLWDLPGLTTNLEWGVWHRSGKVVLGAPPGTPKMRYLRHYAQQAGAPQAHSLPEAARIAVQLASVGR